MRFRLALCLALVFLVTGSAGAATYFVSPADLATAKPDFSRPHGTGSNPFGYDWDVDPPKAAFGAPAGFGSTSFYARVDAAGTIESEKYTAFRIGFRSLFGRPVSVGEVASISYYTKKPAPQTAIDWWLTLYTTNQNDGYDQSSWYRNRIQSHPTAALSLNAPADQWNLWSTSAGDNQLRFFTNRTGFTTEDMFWSEISGGAVTRSTYTWDFSGEEVMMLDVKLGSSSGGGTGESQVDGVTITLTDGETAVINLTSSLRTILQQGGSRLAEKQCADGAWGWPLDGPTTYGNTLGPIAMGLGRAYRATGDAAMLTALQNAAAYLQTKTEFSPSDGYLAAELDSILGGSADTDYVKANFYDKLAAGTYLRKGVYYSTTSYISFIRTSRSGSQANMAAWDIGMGLAGAFACGADITEWVKATKAEINELDSNNYYDVVGLAGAVYGLATVGEDFDPTAGAHEAASDLGDLAATLATYQIVESGGFTWNAGYVIPDDGNEAIQETAYSMMALDAVGGYSSNILHAASYTAGVQLPTGGWEGYVGSGENNEITGEALWGISLANKLSVSVSPLYVKPGDPVNVTLAQANLVDPAAAYQAFLTFDPDKLTLANMAYSPTSPFGYSILPIPSPLESTGSISLAAGLDFMLNPVPEPTMADAALANMEFTAGDVEGVARISFGGNALPSRFTDTNGDEIETSTLDGQVMIDKTPPSITAPADVTVDADAGCGYATGVELGTPVTSDNFGVASVTNDAPTDGHYPIGDTTVTWTVTDLVGYTNTATQKVTVNGTSKLDVTVVLQPNITGSFTRTISFIVGGDDTGAVAPPPAVNADVDFTDGVGSTTIDVPATGNWTCITAKDQQHTLRSQTSVMVSGQVYTADFNGSPLKGGDLNNDNWVDILDFGVFIGQFGTSYPGPRLFPARDADITGDGYVDSADFGFISTNFLDGSDHLCGTAGAVLAAASAGGPRTSISVKELAEIIGMKDARKADINKDRVVDAKDVQLFIKGKKH